MRKYETSIPIVRKNYNTTFSQAANIFFGRLCWLLPFAIAVDVIAYYGPNIILFPIPEILVLLFAVSQFGKNLIVFTLQDREIHYIKEEVANTEENAPNTDGFTTIPQPNGRGFYNLSVVLTKNQLHNIVETLLNTETLTVNYLESIGLSRQDAEKLRIELVKFELMEYDKRGRVHINKNGVKTCEQILAKS